MERIVPIRYDQTPRSLPSDDTEMRVYHDRRWYASVYPGAFALESMIDWEPAGLDIFCLIKGDKPHSFLVRPTTNLSYKLKLKREETSMYFSVRLSFIGKPEDSHDRVRTKAITVGSGDLCSGVQFLIPETVKWSFLRRWSVATPNEVGSLISDGFSIQEDVTPMNVTPIFSGGEVA